MSKTKATAPKRIPYQTRPHKTGKLAWFDPATVTKEWIGSPDCCESEVRIRGLSSNLVRTESGIWLSRYWHIDHPFRFRHQRCDYFELHPEGAETWFVKNGQEPPDVLFDDLEKAALATAAEIPAVPEAQARMAEVPRVGKPEPVDRDTSDELTDTARMLLKVLLKESAFDVNSTLATGAASRASGGKLPNLKKSLKIVKAKNELRACKFIVSEPGRKGGMYLTDAGRAFAEKNTP